MNSTSNYLAYLDPGDGDGGISIVVGALVVLLGVLVVVVLVALVILAVRFFIRDERRSRRERL